MTLTDRTLTLGFSPCPNDTFLFHALSYGLVKAPGIEFEVDLQDVETLNQRAKEGHYHITKLSFGALADLLNRYGLIRSGSALGRGCGPLIVARPGYDPESLGKTPVAVPGLMTTARRLLELYLPQKPFLGPMSFDLIMPAIQSGQFDFGVIIHEGRFTYSQYGLVQVVDLGQWWEEKTGLPIPLGGIAVKRDLGADVARAVETAIKQSVLYARQHPEASHEYVTAHAQEMEPAVIGQHIDLYVNDFTIDLGRDGEVAVRAFLGQGSGQKATGQSIFAC